MKDKKRMNKELFLALKNGACPTTYEDFHRLFSNALRGVTFEGDSALHIAAREGHKNIVEWILRMEPSLAQVRNKDDNTPLHEAARNRDPALVDILLRHNKSCASQRNKFEETPLIVACKYGHKETVNKLLESDTIETHQSPRQGGATSHLHAAVHGGNLEIVKAILNHHVGDHAWHNDLMIEKDRSGRCAVHVAAMKGRWDIVSEFMSSMPDCVEIRSSDHKSVLHFAVEYDQLEVVQNLLKDEKPEKKAELVSRDHDLFHNTALHLAAKNGVDPQLLDCLLSLPGVDVNALNDEGMTALGIVSAAPQDNTNCATIAAKLESAGAIRSRRVVLSNTTSDPRNDSKQRRAKDIVDLHVIVASLIATVTFAAIFQIPGGTEDERKRIQYGGARKAFHKVFKLFMFSDTAAFSTSLTLIVVWLFGEAWPTTDCAKSSMLSLMSALSLTFSILWTIVAFITAGILVILPRNLHSLKNEDKKSFKKYISLLGYQVYFAVLPPIYAIFLAVCLRWHRIRIMMRKFGVVFALEIVFIITMLIIQVTLT